MTTTSDDNNNGDQDDIMREDDFTPHLSHPGTENSENPNEFHMVASDEQLDRLYESHPRLHQGPRETAEHQLTQPSAGDIGSNAAWRSLIYNFLPLHLLL